MALRATFRSNTDRKVRCKMDKRNLILLIAGLLLLGASVGCQRQEKSPPPTVTPIPGWQKFEGETITFWLPESYLGLLK